MSKAVIVTTKHRGIFFGYTEAGLTDSELELTQARMIVYHSADSHGVVGCAERGPGRGARVSPSVKRLGLRDVIAVIECTETAVTNIEEEPWS